MVNKLLLVLCVLLLFAAGIAYYHVNLSNKMYNEYINCIYTIGDPLTMDESIRQHTCDSCHQHIYGYKIIR